jgi:hypothetical protein
MDQQQQQPTKAEDLVRKLKPWWGIALVGLLALVAMGAALAIHYAGQVTTAKKLASYQKADDSWIDHEPDRVAHAAASTTPAASSSPAPAAEGGGHDDAAVSTLGAKLRAASDAESCSRTAPPGI